MVTPKHEASLRTRFQAISPVRARRGISFSNEPPPLRKHARPTWTKAMDHRLHYLQSQVEEHQRAWSAGQEEFVHELEKLQDAKRKFDRFVRRRSKDHEREGSTFKDIASQDNSEGEIQLEPKKSLGLLKRKGSSGGVSEEDSVQTPGLGGLINRVKSLHTSDESEGQKRIGGILGRIKARKRARSIV
ncbi:MAG: hypothetical protein M1825_005867 [Sarcosagium campestre]|nr:MAG: hypothetical protein M1825_005867 [Sarcosagium campestre]